MNDFVLFTVAGAGSLLSGAIYAAFGWLVLIYVVSILVRLVMYLCPIFTQIVVTLSFYHTDGGVFNSVFLRTEASQGDYGRRTSAISTCRWR